MMLQIPSCPATKLRYHHITIPQEINIELGMRHRLGSIRNLTQPKDNKTLTVREM